MQLYHGIPSTEASLLEQLTQNYWRQTTNDKRDYALTLLCDKIVDLYDKYKPEGKDLEWMWSQYCTCQSDLGHRAFNI